MKRFISVFTLILMLVVLTTTVFADSSKKDMADEPLATGELPPVDLHEPYIPQQNNGDIVISGVIVDPPIVVVDPGHGGADPGAVNTNKPGLAGHSYLMEKDVVLDVGLKLKDYLIAYYGATVYMTRETDIRLGATQNEDLKARVDFANSKNPNIFVSIHVNANEDPSKNGVETYYYYTADKELATDVYNELLYTGLYGRGVKSNNYYVLVYTNAYSTLTENGFISNSSDADKLLSNSFRQDLATRHARGIVYRFWQGN